VSEISAPQFLFLPTRPQWAIAILEGTKKWKLRTKRPSIDADVVVVSMRLRRCAPSSAASSRGKILSGTALEVWKSVRGEIASTRASYFDAFGSSPVVLRSR
jgi:hypothetical protein